MKKVLVASLLVFLAASLLAGVAAAKVATTKEFTGPLHDYMEEALAEKLNLPLATVESEFAAGKTLAQIALDHGIAQADLQAFMLEVRTLALQNAVADGVLTQAQADRMLQMHRGGFGYGMMSGGTGYGMMGSGTGPCGGTGIPVGGGMMQRGGRWQQTNP